MANFDIASFNLLNWANSVVDLYDSTPKDVEIIQKDNNGNLITKDIANRGKFKQELWDDVGSALGQFKRKFYVDAENGDDNNTGDSDHPFKTIQKACNSVPIGGTGSIYLQSNQTYTIENDIVIFNKVLFFDYFGDTDDTIIINKAYVSHDNIEHTTGFVATQTTITFTHLTIKTANLINSDDSFSSYVGIIKKGSSNSFINIVSCSLLIGDSAFYKKDFNATPCVFNIRYHNNNSSSNKTIDCVGSNQNALFIDNYDGAPAIYLTEDSTTLGTKNDGSTDLTWKDLVNGVVKDSNGVVLNAVSNINFE